MNKTLLFLLSPLLLLTFCDKDPAIEGNSPNDALDKVDTLSFEAHTLPQSPLDGLNEVNFPLGNLSSPVYGKTSASIFTQVLLTTTSFEPGANAVLDSAVLEIVVEGKYGPMDLPVTYNVFEMTEAIDNNNSYDTETSLAFDNTLLGSVSYSYSQNSELLKIPLNTTFASALFAQLGTSTTQNNINFTNYLNGIYLQPDNQTGGDGHLNLDLTNDISGIKLYFRSDSPSDSVYRFSMSTDAQKVNNYVHDFTGSELQDAFNDLSNNDEDLLIGGLSTSKAMIDIPDLSFLQGSVINQAEITFAQTDYGDPANDGYNVPLFLLLYGEKPNDTIQYFLTDYNSTAPTTYGGLAALEEVNGAVTHTYSYKIPRFIQRVVDETTDIEFFVLQTVNFNAANRVKLGGGTHPNSPIKLEILYTKP